MSRPDMPPTVFGHKYKDIWFIKPIHIINEWERDMCQILLRKDNTLLGWSDPNGDLYNTQGEWVDYLIGAGDDPGPGETTMPIDSKIVLYESESDKSIDYIKRYEIQFDGRGWLVGGQPFGFCSHMGCWGPQLPNKIDSAETRFTLRNFVEHPGQGREIVQVEGVRFHLQHILTKVPNDLSMFYFDKVVKIQQKVVDNLWVDTKEEVVYSNE